MNRVQMMNLYLVGVRCEHVPPFRCLKPVHVKKFDKGGKRLFDMRKCMSIVEDIARKNGVWRPANAGDGYWNGRTVQTLWDGVCDEILLHLVTKTVLQNVEVSLHKSFQSRSFYFFIIELFSTCSRYFMVVLWLV